MPPDESSVTAVGHVIQLAIAPVFLLTGMSSLLATLTSRVGRIIDRARIIEREIAQLDELKKGEAHEELKLLSNRASGLSP